MGQTIQKQTEVAVAVVAAAVAAVAAAAAAEPKLGKVARSQRTLPWLAHHCTAPARGRLQGRDRPGL